MTTNCSKCNCEKTPCGCEDRGLTTNPPCATGTPACPNPEPCAETWSDCCVIHNGDSFVYIKTNPIVTGFNILQGERLCDTLQRFIVYYENGGFCTVETPYGLKSKNITASTLTIGWTPISPVDSYEVFYSPASSVAFVSAGVVMPSTSPTITITGLLANTTYYVYVKAKYQNNYSCNSVSLILTTKLI